MALGSGRRRPVAAPQLVPDAVPHAAVLLVPEAFDQTKPRLLGDAV
jgi:hypothetical protein